MYPVPITPRFPKGLVDGHQRRVPASEVVKLLFHLYKTPQNTYVLDIQKTYGQSFLFMDISGRIMTDLKVLKLASQPQ